MLAVALWNTQKCIMGVTVENSSELGITFSSSSAASASASLSSWALAKLSTAIAKNTFSNVSDYHVVSRIKQRDELKFLYTPKKAEIHR